MTVADNEGIKPIDLAREHGFDDCAHELFRAAKTSVTVRDETARTCTHIVLYKLLLSNIL